MKVAFIDIGTNSVRYLAVDISPSGTFSVLKRGLVTPRLGRGLDEKGKQLIGEGIIDADIAFFPERYGDYLIPAALANIYGNPVPPYIFMENAVITPENIGKYYP